MPSEKVNDQADRTFRSHKFHLFRLSGKHVQVLVHIVLEIQPVFQAFHLAFRFHRSLQQGNICNPVNTVVGNRIVMVVVADQVVPPLAGHHLVRIQRLAFHGAVCVHSGMQFHIRSIVVVGNPDLFPGGNRLVQDIDGVEQLRILRGVRRHAVHMVHPLVEIGAGKLSELINQLLPLLIRNRAGK